MTDLLQQLGQVCADISRTITGSYPAGMDPELVMRRRVGKVFVEAGELGDAIEGYTGENMRKGVYATAEDVIKELLDCASAALCAVEFMTGDRGTAPQMLLSQVIGNQERLQREVPPQPVAEPFGTALHDAAAGEMVEVLIPPIPPIPVRKSSDLSFREVSVIPGPPDPSKGTYPIVSVRDAGCVERWPECWNGGYDPRCCRFPKSCSCEVVPEPPADASWVTFEDARGRRTDLQGNPVPPADDPDGGRRGD